MKKYSSLRSRIENNPLIILLYKFLFYFEMGRAQIGRFYGFIPELLIIIGFILYAFKVEITIVQTIIVLTGLSLLFFIFGLLMKKSGMFDATMHVNNEKNPIMKEVYEAAQKINNFYDGKK